MQEPGRILGPNGLPIGGRIRSDKERIDATGKHLVRGLYYALTKSRLPEAAELTIGCKAGLDDRDELMTVFLQFWEQWPDRVEKQVGDGFGAASGGQSM
jgi:hypothetical protein